LNFIECISYKFCQFSRIYFSIHSSSKFKNCHLKLVNIFIFRPNFLIMKFKKTCILIPLFFLISLGFIPLLAQKIDFTLKYNNENNLYEVYGKADFTDGQFFVGGGSQLSIILPTDLIDYPLTIQSVAGGPWTDNSQVYAPQADATHDYHGIATNGSKMNFQKDLETLLFTFKLPEIKDEKAIRLFDNQKDPHSNKEGMSGADFCNFFACALTVKNVYNGIYTKELPIKLPIVSVPTVLTPEFELYQNQPNPFKTSTAIGFLLPEVSPISLTFRDVSGRVLKVIEQTGHVGYNTINIQRKDFQKGWIHYQLDTKFGSKNKKMILLE